MSYYLVGDLNLTFWPDSEVEKSWEEITFEFEELVENVGIRYNGGTYAENYKDVLKVSTLPTLHYGRCYTLHFFPFVNFAKFDNLVLRYKRNILLFAQGTKDS